MTFCYFDLPLSGGQIGEQILTEIIFFLVVTSHAFLIFADRPLRADTKSSEIGSLGYNTISRVRDEIF